MTRSLHGYAEDAVCKCQYGLLSPTLAVNVRAYVVDSLCLTLVKFHQKGGMCCIVHGVYYVATLAIRFQWLDIGSLERNYKQRVYERGNLYVFKQVIARNLCRAVRFRTSSIQIDPGLRERPVKNETLNWFLSLFGLLILWLIDQIIIVIVWVRPFINSLVFTRPPLLLILVVKSFHSFALVYPMIVLRYCIFSWIIFWTSSIHFMCSLFSTSIYIFPLPQQIPAL